MIKHDLITLLFYKWEKVMNKIGGLILEENEHLSAYHDMDNGTTVFKHFNKYILPANKSNYV